MTRVSKVHHSRVAGADNIAFFFATALAELYISNMYIFLNVPKTYFMLFSLAIIV